VGGKGRRRREARRRAKQRQLEEQPERAPETESVAAGGVVHAASGGEGGHRRSVRRRAKARRHRGWVSPWLIAVPVLAIGAGILAVLTVTSGSSGTTGGALEATPDPRVAGMTPAKSFEIVAGDDGVNPAGSSFFQPDTFTASAGDVVEFTVKNTGSVTHNLWLAGSDNEYDTGDDFGPLPLIKPGETGRLVVKIDEPGTYFFRCQIHPDVQTGTLVLG
jgi:plastocyanin